MSVNYEYDFMKGLYRTKIKTTYKRSDMSMNDSCYSNYYPFESIVLPYERITLQYVMTNADTAIVKFSKPTISYTGMELYCLNTITDQLIKKPVTENNLIITQSNEYYQLYFRNLQTNVPYKFWLKYNIYKSDAVIATTEPRIECFDYEYQKEILDRRASYGGTVYGGVWEGSDYGPWGLIHGVDDDHSIVMSGYWDDSYNISYQASPFPELWLRITPNKNGYTKLILTCKGNIIDGDAENVVFRQMLFRGNKYSSTFSYLTDTKVKAYATKTDIDYAIIFDITGYLVSNDLFTMRYGFMKDDRVNTLTVKYSDIHIWFE